MKEGRDGASSGGDSSDGHDWDGRCGVFMPGIHPPVYTLPFPSITPSWRNGETSAATY